jgi:hypothetical protein
MCRDEGYAVGCCRWDGGVISMRMGISGFTALREMEIPKIISAMYLHTCSYGYFSSRHAVQWLCWLFFDFGSA